MPSPLDDAVAGTVLGDRAFRASIRERVLSEYSIEDIPPAQRNAFRPSLEELFPESSLRDRKERNRLIRTACLDWKYSRSEIAVHLGLSGSTITSILKK